MRKKAEQIDHLEASVYCRYRPTFPLSSLSRRQKKGKKQAGRKLDVREEATTSYGMVEALGRTMKTPPYRVS